MKKVVFQLLIFTALLLPVPFQVSSLVVLAQAGQWAPPLNLFETEGRASEAEVVADSAGTVHVFWAYGAPGAEESGNTQAIYYARKDQTGWSTPLDILVSPGGREARFHSVTIDKAGFLHIVWSGGAALYYSRAYAPEAGSATAWTAPLTLASGTLIAEPAIAVDENGNLYAVWTQGFAGLMFAYSQNGGQRWSTPQVIYRAAQDNELARWGRIAVDQRGRLHVALTYTVRNPANTQERSDPNYLYYLRSDDGGVTWSEPFLVAPEADFGEINVATFETDIVHLVWNGRAGRHGRYHRWSQDGGQSWSSVVEILAPSPENPIGTGGLTGFPTLATDSTGTLHLVSATGRGQYYFSWTAAGWTAPLLISSGVVGGGVTNTTESIEQPSLAIGEGNQLHVVFHDGFERIWYTTAATAAPHQPAISLPTPDMAATLAASPLPTATVAQEPTPVPVRALESTPASTGSPFSPLLVGLLPTLLLLGAFVVFYGARHKR